MRSVDAVRLVAGREIRTWMRSKAYRISTALVCVAVALAIAAPQIFASDSMRTVTIAVVDGAHPPTFDAATAQVADQLGVDVEIVAVDPAGVRSLVEDGDADVGVVDLDAVWRSDIDPIEEAILRSGLQAEATEARSAELGIALADAAELLRPVALSTTTIEPVDEDEVEKIATAMVGVILLFLAIQFHGAAVLQGVIEEKSSRVVEILLTHLRATHLLAGKIVGIGVVGLSQAAAVAIVALTTSSAINGADVPELDAVLVLSSVGWFLLGFLLYATVFATAGSLVSRQEDAQAATAPLAIPFIAAYIVSISIVENPDSLVGRVASMFPLTAPLSMPVRLAAGSPSVLEVVVAVVSTVLATAGLIELGGRIYRRNLLRTGVRVSWRDALRGIRTPTALD